jgi:hypothetical protein
VGVSGLAVVGVKVGTSARCSLAVAVAAGSSLLPKSKPQPLKAKAAVTKQNKITRKR